MVSGNYSYDNKALRSTHRVMRTKDFYVTPEGVLKNSPVNYTVELTIQNMN